jgi:hypothetical protein
MKKHEKLKNQELKPVKKNRTWRKNGKKHKPDEMNR